MSRRTDSANADPGLSSHLAIPAQTNVLDNMKNVGHVSIRLNALGRTACRADAVSEVGSDIWHATKLAGPLAAPSPGLRLTLEPEIKRYRSANEVLQRRLINLLPFADVYGAPDIPLEAGVE